MSSSTAVQYALDATNYIWDTIRGYFVVSGGFKFFMAILILFGVITIAIAAVKKIFHW